MLVTPKFIQEVLDKAEKLHTPDEVELAAARMAEEISSRIGESNPLLLTVMVGGLIPTALLLKYMNFPLEMDYVHATRYQKEVAGGELIWKVHPTTNLKARTILVVDDILDGGVTLKRIIEHCEQEGAHEVLSAVLVEKIGTSRADGLKEADFMGIKVPDKFVFGYGMDYKGYLRNAPGVFAVDEQHHS